ncbi:hypothetical protein LCGC14_0585220 [marine sediment metagenome]|uniref:MotA/TolQ/ExbB proton channel domain-containing protein n=1 Tax=marine sediment metagenome TaxID=412755 RepID=A0A0F9RF49_9ZZZZ
MPNIGVNAVIAGVVASIFGVVGFAVVKAFVGAQDTASWSAAELSIIVTAVPIGVALMAFLAAFGGLSAIHRG